jgi:photosystem II P680 reaction center D1 protein
VVGIWFASLAVASFSFNLNGLNFNHSVVDH